MVRRVGVCRDSVEGDDEDEDVRGEVAMRFGLSEGRGDERERREGGIPWDGLSK